MHVAPSSPSPTTLWAAAIKSLTGHQARQTTLAVVLDDLVIAHAGRTALTCEDETLTYAELASRRNAYARWAQVAGVAQGHVVGLLLHNCSDYVSIWLGITYGGATVALLNTNLTGTALLHSLVIGNVRHLIVGSHFQAIVENIADQLPAELRIWRHGEALTRPMPANTVHHGLYSDEPLGAHERPAANLQSAALLIYTSGTTGLPKAAVITHARIIEWGAWFVGMMGVTPSDRLYNCLPLYHSTGGVVGVSAMLLGGGTIVVARRFSATRIWDDLARKDCSILLYVGELCRRLTDAPTDTGSPRHRLRLCCGNGLSGDVWRRFVHRFGPFRILEFYASTEGNISLYNCEERVGAIGRIPTFLQHRFPIALVTCDPVSGEAVRDQEGYVQRSGVDQPGEAIGRIAMRAGADTSVFDGYTDLEATQRKILRHVFDKDDAWFRTGDLMRRDAAGYYYFIDRLGDTFRWKGENVSTSEVAEVIGGCPGVTCAVVYGVCVPHADGKAGMAAITVNPDFDLADLNQSITALPAYARPVFLRLCDTIEVTGTFKPIKARLAAEGYNPDVVSDPVYILTHRSSSFSRFGQGSYADVIAGRLRL